MVKNLKVPYLDIPVMTIERDGKLYVVMKQVVDGLGLAWWPQRKKVKSRFAKKSITAEFTNADGKRVKALCLELGCVPIWIYTINPAYVKPELRDKIIACQEECDNALFGYMTTGEARRAI